SLQVLEAGLDVGQAGFRLPVTLGRKVDDPARIDHASSVEDEHLAQTYFARVAGAPVRIIVAREGLLELQGDTLAHHPDAVDRINDGLGARLEQVAFREGDHRRLPSSTRRIFPPLSS